MFQEIFEDLILKIIKKPRIINLFVMAEKDFGKTTFLTGLYKNALDTSKGPTMPSVGLVSLLKEIYNEDLIPASNRGIYDCSFAYETDDDKIKLNVVNYPGGLLYGLGDVLFNKIDNDFHRIEMVKIIAHEILNTDKIIIIIDGSCICEKEKVILENYFKIINRLQDIDKKVKYYVVVTKCDHFIKEYPNYENDYEGFRRFIEEKLYSYPFIRELININIGTDSSIYPVFYYTQPFYKCYNCFKSIGKEREKCPFCGDTNIVEEYRMPIIEDNGNLLTYGFDKILEKIIDK